MAQNEARAPTLEQKKGGDGLNRGFQKVFKNIKLHLPEVHFGFAIERKSALKRVNDLIS